MNELYINYSRFKEMTISRKRIQRGVGILFSGAGVFLVISELIGNQSLAFTISAICNLLLGITFFGQTYDLELFYPRNFIRITGDVVEYKLWSYRKVVSIDWSSVKTIERNPSSLLFVMEDERRIRFKMKFLPTSDVKRIAPLLETIAQQKKIEITLPNHRL